MSHMTQLKCTNPIFANGKTKVTYGFMDPQYGLNHYGADLVPGTGTEEAVIAIEEGRVIKVKADVNRTLSVNVKENWSSPDALGNYVVLKHPNGYISKYCHLKFRSLCVKIGDNLKKGAKLGIIGSTGLSTAPHVHFEIWTNENDRSSRIDPEPFIIGTKSLKGSAPSPPKPENPSKDVDVRVLAYSAKMREQPSMSSQILKVIETGNTVKVLPGGEKRDRVCGLIYIKVDCGGKIGWIVKSALK
ncbi:MAG: M23 family metallopeptidase [Oscillospiraceae bacterium]|nr:M23 family metallopeptidase [Oscillospiraceae bacterium]